MLSERPMGKQLLANGGAGACPRCHRRKSRYKTSRRMPMPINEALSAPARPCSSNVGTVANIFLAKMDKDDAVWLDPCKYIGS